MCGLFGYLHYGDNKLKNLSNLTNVLAEEAAIRGTDATGIAYCNNGRIVINKEAKSAYNIDFKHSDDIHTLIGHTRHSTQGSEKKNHNNHPFLGKCRNNSFALAHNGVLINDNDLRKKNKLPKTKIETDSYIAVQLIEQKKRLDNKSIKQMAEAVEGSFSFSILDDAETLWLVKGDSPIKIIHFPSIKLYVYASTEEILWRALIETFLFDELKKNNYEEINIREGDLLNILPDGTIVRDKFNYTEYYGSRYNWRSYSSIGYGYYDTCETAAPRAEYIEDLKYFASCYGYDPDVVDELISEGFTLDEVEEFIYCEEVR